MYVETVLWNGYRYVTLTPTIEPVVRLPVRGRKKAAALAKAATLAVGCLRIRELNGKRKFARQISDLLEGLATISSYREQAGSYHGAAMPIRSGGPKRRC